MSFKITTIHAFIATDDDDEEGVIGELMGDQWLPFVCADETRVADLRPRAELIAATLGVKVTLARFSVREDVEVIG
jgi:hypothetical protein